VIGLEVITKFKRRRLHLGPCADRQDRQRPLPGSRSGLVFDSYDFSGLRARR
jgi:hypothetical protein